MYEDRGCLKRRVFGLKVSRVSLMLRYVMRVMGVVYSAAPLQVLYNLLSSAVVKQKSMMSRGWTCDDEIRNVDFRIHDMIVG
jgi:hypothetical protein